MGCRRSRPSIVGKVACLGLVALMLCAPMSAMAKDKDKESGLRYQGDLSFRIIPLGLSLASHLGYHKKLFNSTSTLFKDSYVEAGGKFIISPAMTWGGAYIKAQPIALLDMKLSATYNYYFGTFGLLHVPEDQERAPWGQADISVTEDLGAGKSTGGFVIEAQINPKIRIGDIVAFCPITWSYISANVDGKYYEPWYDYLFAPEDSLLMIQPTVGMIPYSNKNGTFLMTAFRWEHATTKETGLSRDLASLLLLWGLPKSWISTGSPRLAILAGYWVSHPEDRDGSAYLGTNFSMVLGAK